MAYQKTEYTRKKTEASRNSLLLAAFRLFLIQGYRQTPMHQVVRAAGTSIGNVYFYFQNKEDLLQAVVRQVTEARTDIIDRISQHFPGGPKRLAVNLFCSAYPSISGGLVAQPAMHAGCDRVLLKCLVMAGVRCNIKLIAENLPGTNHTDIVFAANAWAGAGNGILMARVQGQLDGSATELVTKLVGWQLQAIGLAPTAVAAGLQATEDLRALADWGNFVATIPSSMENIDTLVMPC